MVFWLTAIFFSAILVGESVAQSKTPKTLPGTMADYLLQEEVVRQLIMGDTVADPSCNRFRRVVRTEVTELPRGQFFPDGRLRSGGWDERWTLERCGAEIPYLVKFIADGKGGTFIKFSVSLKR
ncbi:MAG TPA: hypothetical protein VJL09_01535 [Candidatus Paceibacterota bacterium]